MGKMSAYHASLRIILQSILSLLGYREGLYAYLTSIKHVKMETCDYEVDAVLHCCR